MLQLLRILFLVLIAARFFMTGFIDFNTWNFPNVLYNLVFIVSAVGLFLFSKMKNKVDSKSLWWYFMLFAGIVIYGLLNV